MNVVYELRQRAGLTQELLAGLAGVDRSMISRYETGRRSPRLDTLELLAGAVDLEVVVSFRPASVQGEVDG
jgi:transcriptional regulator with XRE-family HTH domain